MTINSNLSKTKTAFRTSGGVTGNFGAGRRTGGSVLNDIPNNNRESLGNFPMLHEYRTRLLTALEKTDSPSLRQFLHEELAKLDRRRAGTAPRVDAPPQGPFCYLNDHHISRAQ